MKEFIAYALFVVGMLAVLFASAWVVARAIPWETLGL